MLSSGTVVDTALSADAEQLQKVLLEAPTKKNNQLVRTALTSSLVPDEAILAWLRRQDEVSLYLLHTLAARPVPFSEELVWELIKPGNGQSPSDILLLDLAQRVDLPASAAIWMVLNEDGSPRVSRQGQGQNTNFVPLPASLAALRNPGTPLSVVRAVYEAPHFPGDQAENEESSLLPPRRGSRAKRYGKVREESLRACRDHPRFPLPFLAHSIVTEDNYATMAEAVVFGARRQEAQALVAANDPELAGLPDRLLVEVLSLMNPPAEWDEPLPPHPSVQQ